MSNFNFYKADKAYGELFLQFPKVFLYSNKYKKLSNDAKIAYMVFKDRLQYSLKNNWIDKENNVYFIFTNDEICQMLGKSRPTAIKIKKELEEVGLLLQVQQGFNPRKKRNEPNRLYMADLEVDATDVYSFQNIDNRTKSLDTSGSKDSLPRQENAVSLGTSGSKKYLPRQEINKNLEPLDTSGSKDSLPRQENAVSLDASGSKDSLLELDIELSTKDVKDIKEISKSDKIDIEMISNSFKSKEKDPEIEQQVINDYIEEQGLYLLYGKKLIDRMKMFSFNDFDTFTTFINKLEFAQKSIEKEAEITLPIYEGSKYFEFIEQELLRTFNRAIHQHRFGKVNNIASYLFISFKNVFEDLATTIKEETSNTTV